MFVFNRASSFAGKASRTAACKGVLICAPCGCDEIHLQQAPTVYGGHVVGLVGGCCRQPASMSLHNSALFVCREFTVFTYSSNTSCLNPPLPAHASLHENCGGEMSAHALIVPTIGD
jgi:hypothetical protein